MDIRSELQATLSGNYTLERELGGGGMSRVFVAEETRLGRKVVVKVLSPELAAGISAERFEREIRLAASLQQANIVPVLSAGDSSGIPFYTMPYVEGESLRVRLERGPLSLAETTGILRDVAKALAYAHERGIVHRDIKPDNVLLSGGTAVVTDFGIAKAISDARTEAAGATLTQLGTSVGTPAYISPEQAAGDPNIDHRADLYSFGCMAYELLAGHPPFTGRSPQRLMAAHMSETPQSIIEVRPDTPPALAAMVMRCLEKDPEQRPRNAAELGDAIAAATTSGSTHESASANLLGGRGMFVKALAAYAAAFIVVIVVAKAAIVGIGLPDWVLPGAVVVMALGLPVVLFTGYAQRVTRRAASASAGTTGTMAGLALRASPYLSWRRTMAGGASALVVFVLLIGGFMLLGALGMGPGASLVARGSVANREPLLITDFKTHGADTNLGSVVTEAVRADMAQSSTINLVSPVRVAAALQRMQRPSTARVDLALAREIAAREGIKAIVDGEITPLGAGYVVAARLVSADSGIELTSSRTVVKSPADLIDGINKVSKQLRGKIGESLRSVQSSPALAQVTTGSLDALRKFTEASRANREADYARAVALFRQAVAIDSMFATAWTGLSVAMSNGRPFPQSQQDSVQMMAYRFRDHLPVRARTAVEARYFQSGPGYDLRRAAALYGAMFAEDSSAGLANSLGNVLDGMGEYARAESLYTFAMQRSPDLSFPYGNSVLALFNQGKTREAEARVALARQRHPEYLTAVIMRALLLYHAGDLTGYRRALDSLRSTRVPRLRTTGTSNLADLAMLTGRMQESARLLAEGRSLDSASGLTTPPLVDSIGAAVVDAWFREQPQRAAKRLDDAVAQYPLKTIALADRPYVALASAYAMSGRPDRAREILRQFAADADSTMRRTMEPGIAGARGDIAIAEGKPRDAVPEFRKSADWQRLRYSREPALVFARIGRAFDLAHESDSAIVMFERFLSTPSWDRTATGTDPMYLAAVSKRLGELYEAKGDRQKAASHYAKFVELWKDADADLQPKVADVRKRLARLSDTEAKR